jgi:hypothetical protein
MRHRVLRAGLLALVPAAVVPALAWGFHRTTPTVTALTTGGDQDLPRVHSQGTRAIALAVEAGSAARVVTLLPFRSGGAQTPLADDARSPATSFTGRSFAWETAADPLGSGAPGSQVIVSANGTLLQAAVDPTGTSANPALDRTGATVAFESEGDLAGTGNAGVRQIFLRDPTGVVVQVSAGHGASRDPVLSVRQRMIAYESASDPVTGTDTGIPQIWAGRVDRLPASRITGGQGPSRSPAVSTDGRLVAFESTADLAGDGADTATPQIFVYHPRTGTYAQVTAEPAGCTRPAVAPIKRDWRIAFVCGGQAYFHMLREQRRYQVPTAGGHTQAIAPGLGVHFVMLSTTADLLSGGTTAGHRIYLLRLFENPAAVVQVAGAATWFPFQGI